MGGGGVNGGEGEWQQVARAKEALVPEQMVPKGAAPSALACFPWQLGQPPGTAR